MCLCRAARMPSLLDCVCKHSPDFWLHILNIFGPKVRFHGRHPAMLFFRSVSFVPKNT